MKKINPRDVVITTKFNMDEISTVLETLDCLIREDNCFMDDHDFRNKVHSLRKGVQAMYGQAFDYKKEQESQQQLPMRNPMYDIMEEDDPNNEDICEECE